MKPKKNTAGLISSIIILVTLFGAYAFKNSDIFYCLTNCVIYAFVFLCSLAILIVAYILLFVKKLAIQKVFLIVGSAIALVSLLINTPGAVPDEPSHIGNAYLLSNRLLGISDMPLVEKELDVYQASNTSVRREDSVVLDQVVGLPTTHTYKQILSQFHLFVSEDGAELVPGTLIDHHVPLTAYFPAVVGMTLARLLNLGCIPMLYMGRLFMLAFYIYGVWWAIKRIPFGKIMLFIIAILPMSMNIAPSYSYDSVIITLAMMLTAEVLYLAYGSIRKIDISEMILCGLIVFIFSSLKVLVYLPMVALFFIVPKLKFKTKGVYYIFGFSMLLLGLLSVVMANLSIITAYDPNATMTNFYITSDVPAYTGEWILHHPLETLGIMINTTVEKYSFYYSTMIGGLLGWLNFPVGRLIVDGLTLCLLASCLKEWDAERVRIPRKHRIAFIAVILLVYLFFLIGMMVWWTLAGENVIDGIQGRYFIPVLPFLLLLVKDNPWIEVRKGFHRIAAAGAVILTLAAFSNVLARILAPL